MDDESTNYQKLWPNGLSVCTEHTWDGKQGCKTMANVLGELSKDELNYGRGLIKAAEQHDISPEEQGMQLFGAWTIFKSGLTRRGTERTELSNFLQKQSKEMHTFRHQQSVIKRKVISQGNTAKSELEKLKAKTKSTYDKYQQLVKDTENLIRGKEDQGTYFDLLNYFYTY